MAFVILQNCDFYLLTQSATLVPLGQCAAKQPLTKRKEMCGPPCGEHHQLEHVGGHLKKLGEEGADLHKRLGNFFLVFDLDYTGSPAHRSKNRLLRCVHFFLFISSFLEIHFNAVCEKN